MPKPNRDLRRLGIFLAVGLVAGTGVRYYIESRARARKEKDTLTPLIDWDNAHKVALRVSQWEKAPLENREFRQSQYKRLVEKSEPLIEEYLGVSLPQPVSRVHVFDRREWLEANFVSFQQLFKPIEALYNDSLASRSALAILMGDMNGQMLGAQIGLLLGFLGKRVLGQYDLSLFSPEPNDGGALYYVEPNIARIQQKLGLNDEDFRLWIALHETTHAFEFEAYPWVREHFNSLLQQYFDQLNTQLNTLGTGLPQTIMRIVQQINSKDHWIELLLTPEQRKIFDQLQALMSLVEGYSNHIMNAIGSQLLPSFKQIEDRMNQRQKSKTLIEKVFYRLTGMDLKMVQYQQGEAFVNMIVDERGIAFASRVWDCAENLPTLDEIRNPQQWIARIDATGTDGG